MWSLNHWTLNGLGKGTAFRLQISKRLNSEWYGDFIRTQYKNKVFRWDRHLTNCLMYYFRKLDDLEHKIHPFISASVFCLDITEVEEVKPDGGGQKMGRFSFSQQFGLGTHYYLTERADISVYAQYYAHLGNDIHVDEHDDGTIHIAEEKGRISLEGHMFLVFSVGYRLGDLWGKKKR
ncbi:MAG: hypothetical protein ACE5DN_00055 [Flavobacteriales bacterium]